MADTRFDLGRSKIMLAEEDSVEEMQQIFRELIEEGNRLLENENIFEGDRSFVCSVDCRYSRQNYEINIPIDSLPSDAVLDKMCADFLNSGRHIIGSTGKNTSRTAFGAGSSKLPAQGAAAADMKYAVQTELWSIPPLKSSKMRLK